VVIDPLASTALVADADGNPLSRSRYTPFGDGRHVRVAETQVWNGSAWEPYAPDPTEPIPETDYLYQGDYLERELGLYFTGDGRYYDPWLGKYLQPDPMGGPPLLPQAADRYQYAGNSPTGVGWIGTARDGGGIDLLSPSAWASVAADVGLEVAGHHLLLKPGVLTLRGFAPELFGAIAFQNFPGRYALLRNAPRRLVGNLGVYDVTVRGDIIDDLGGGMFGFRRAGTMLDASGLKVARYERGLLLGESKLASAAVSMGLTFVIDVGFEGFGALTGTGRWGNPYWTTDQKTWHTDFPGGIVTGKYSKQMQALGRFQCPITGRFPTKSRAGAYTLGYPRWQCHQEYLPICKPQKALREIGVAGLLGSWKRCCPRWFFGSCWSNLVHHNSGCFRLGCYSRTGCVSASLS
jgi:RHS repeat-associated protein